MSGLDVLRTARPKDRVLREVDEEDKFISIKFT